MAKFKLFAEYRGLRKELYVLFIGRMMTNLGAMIWPVFTLILNRKLGLGAQTIAIATLIFSLVSIPVSLLGGRLADKVNKKYIIVVCDLVSIASYIYCFFAPITIPNMIIFMAASLFQTVEWPAYEALIADFTTSKDRERAYSLGYLGSNLGLVLSPTIAGILFNSYLNLSFLISGISILLSTILIFFFIKDVSKETDLSIAGEYEKEIESKANPIVYIFKNKVILIYIFIAIISSFTYSMFNYLMPLDLGAVYGENGSVIFGTMTSVNCIVVVVFTSLITRIFRKVFDVDKFYLGEGLKLLGFAIFFIFIKTTALCYVAMVIFTYGEIFNTLASSPFLTRRIPASHRGRIMAISSVVVGLVASGMQIGIGAVYDNPNLGSSIAWIIVLSTGVISGVLITIVRVIDKRKYASLYYRYNYENGDQLILKRTNLKLLKEYYKDFERDEAIFLNPLEMEKYVYSEEAVTKYWKKIHAEKNRENFLILLNKEPIGEISLKNIQPNESCVLSIHLKNDKYKHKGYGSNSEKVIIDYAFFNLKLRKIKADTIITNTHSQHVLEKVGFTKVGSDDKFVYYELDRAQV